MKPLTNHHTKRHLFLGIFFLALGGVYLLRNAGLNIPFWLISWHTILLAFGLIIGYKKNFRAGGWVVLVIIGGVFTLKHLTFFDFSGYTTALALIGVGLYLILKPKREMHFCDFGRRKEPIDFGGK